MDWTVPELYQFWPKMRSHEDYMGDEEKYERAQRRGLRVYMKPTIK